MNNVILENVTKIYKRNNADFQALKGVTINFIGTGMVSILGPNGCGKTTLLNVVSLHDWDYSGRLFINDVEMKNKNSSSIRNTLKLTISTINQFIELFNQFSCYSNFEIFLSEQGISEEYITKLSKELDVSELLLMPVPTLSGGQKQKIALLAILMRYTDVIIADEPTSNLDIESEMKIFNMFKWLSKTKLVIIATHNKGLAYSLSNRVIELKDGTIISDVLIENKTDRISIYKNHVIIPNSMNATNDQWPEIYNSLVSNGSLTMSLLDVNERSLSIKNSENHTINSNSNKLKNKVDNKLINKKVFSFDSNKLFTSILSIAIIVFVITFFALSNFKIENALVDSIKGNEVERIAFNKVSQQNADFSYIEPVIPIEIENITQQSQVSFHYSLSTDLQIIPNDYFNENDEYSNSSLYGYVFAEEDDLTFITGGFPTAVGEVAITDFTASMLMDYFNIDDMNDIIGNTYNFGQNTFTISGIINTDCETYSQLKDYNSDMYNIRNIFRLNQKNIYGRLYLPLDLFHQYLIQNSMLEFINNRQQFRPYLEIVNTIDSNDIVYQISDSSYGVYVNETLYDEIINSRESDPNNTVLYISVYSNQLSINEDISILGVLSDEVYGSDYKVILSSNTASDIVNIYSSCDGILFDINNNFTSSLVSELDRLNYKDMSFISSNIYELNKLIVQGHDLLFVVLVVVVFVYFIMQVNYINQDYKKNKKEIGLEKSLGWSNTRIYKIHLLMHILNPFIIFLFSVGISVIVFRLINWLLTTGIGYVVQLLNISFPLLVSIFVISNFFVYVFAYILLLVYTNKDIKELLQ